MVIVTRYRSYFSTLQKQEIDKNENQQYNLGGKSNIG